MPFRYTPYVRVEDVGVGAEADDYVTGQERIFTRYVAGGTIISKGITLGGTRLVVIVGCAMSPSGNPISAIGDIEIQKGGVAVSNQTRSFASECNPTYTGACSYIWMGRAYKELAKGTYTFDLVNTSGGDLDLMAFGIEVFGLESIVP